MWHSTTLVRDECLNEQWFETLYQARSAIIAWLENKGSAANRAESVHALEIC